MRFLMVRMKPNTLLISIHIPSNHRATTGNGSKRGQRKGVIGNCNSLRDRGAIGDGEAGED